MKYIAITAALTLPWGIGGCGGEFGDSEQGTEDVDAVTQAVESASRDTPAAAAVEAFMPGTVGSGPDYQGWIFACDENNDLRYAIVSDNAGTISPWQTIIEDCRGVPTAGLYGGTGSSSIVLYTRRADGHLWEYWWPNILQNTSDPVETDLSAWTGLGSITGSPMIANSDSAGNLSVVVRKPSTSELFSVDWCGDDWVDRPILHSGSTPIRSANSVTARGVDHLGNYTVMGRGLTGSDDGTGWLARKDSCAESYVRVSSADITTSGFGGTPFSATMVEFIPFAWEHRFARFNDRLKRWTTGPGAPTPTTWTNVGQCRINGSVRGAANPGVKENYAVAWTRGGDTTDHTDDLMLIDFESDFDCESVGTSLNIQSAPTAFEHATRSTFTHSAVYKGGSRRVNFYRGDTGQNFTISGLFLP